MHRVAAAGTPLNLADLISSAGKNRKTKTWFSQPPGDKKSADSCSCFLYLHFLVYYVLDHRIRKAPIHKAVYAALEKWIACSREHVQPIGQRLSQMLRQTHAFIGLSFP